MVTTTHGEEVAHVCGEKTEESIQIKLLVLTWTETGTITYLLLNSFFNFLKNVNIFDGG